MQRRSLLSLKHRQKVIKLANKSEAGWLVVKEYYHTEVLASGSEDEKQICKAQEKALKKKKHNASKKVDGERNSSVSTPRFRATNDDRGPDSFPRYCPCPLFEFQQASVHTLPAVTLL